MDMTRRGRTSRTWEEVAPPWAVIVHGAGKPWLKDAFTGMIAWTGEDGQNRLVYLKVALNANSETIFLKPGDDEYVVPWKKATIISPASKEAPGLIVVRVRVRTHSKEGSTLQTIIPMVSGSECGPAFVFGHGERMDLKTDAFGSETFTREVSVGFVDDIGALMFAGLIAGIQEEDGSSQFSIVENTDDAAAA